MKEQLDARTEYIYNHSVPVFYLKYFANECYNKGDEYFTYVTDLSRNITYPCNIANTGGEKYLNTVEYEKILGNEYEKRYAETLRKIGIIDRSVRLNLQLPRGYMDDFFDFIAFIYSHNLYSRQIIAEAVSKSSSENTNVEFHEIDYRCQDIIPKQLFEYWKEEFSKWKLLFIYSSDMELNHITSDLPVTLYSVSPDLSMLKPLIQSFSGDFLYGKDNRITKFPKVEITDNSASLLMPVTNNATIWGFKDYATFDNFKTRFPGSGYSIRKRAETNALILCGAKNYIYSKSKDDIRKLNEYLRIYSNFLEEPLHNTYNPFIDP